MILDLDYSKMAAIAGLVRDIAGRESAETQAAVTWTVLNRLGRTGEAVAETCAAMRADARMAEGSDGGPGGDRFADARYCRAFSAVCAVMARDMPDPAHGALRLHRHDAAPAWARRLEPCALIGSFFFYNDASLFCYRGRECAPRARRPYRTGATRAMR